MNNPHQSTYENGLTPELLTVSANHAGLIAREAAKLGVDVESLFAQAKVSIPETNMPAERISAKEITTLLKVAIQQSRDPAIDLKIYKNIQLGDLDALGFAAYCSSTYLSLIQRLQRFSQYIMSEVAVQLIEDTNGFAMMVDLEGRDLSTIKKLIQDPVLANDKCDSVAEDTKDFLRVVEAFSIGFVKVCNDACQGEVSPDQVYLLSPTHPLRKQEWTSMLPNSVFVDTTFYGLKFNKDIAVKKLPLANPQMARLNDEIIVKHLEQVYQGDLVFKVENLIREGLANNKHGRSLISMQLGMSERSLQQALDNRKTSYSEILVRVRKTLAIQYLREKKLRVNQIAAALGFSNGSNFARSFKAWTGYNPNEFK